MAKKKGQYAKVEVNGIAIGGSFQYSYDGETREIIEEAQFGHDHVDQDSGLFKGGSINLSGWFRKDADAGQQELERCFLSGEKITDVKLYLDDRAGQEVYLQPAADSTPASHAIVTQNNAVSQEAQASGKLDFQLTVSGRMETVSSAASIVAETVGIIEDDLIATGATLLGKLPCIGGEVSDIDCYFEYGTDETFGTDTSAGPDLQTQTPGAFFTAGLTLLTTATKYYYRAVAKNNAGTITVVGRTKSFTTA